MLTLCQGSRSMTTLCQGYVKGGGPWLSAPPPKKKHTHQKTRPFSGGGGSRRNLSNQNVLTNLKKTGITS